MFTKRLNDALPLTSIPCADTVGAYARQMQAGEHGGHASSALSFPLLTSKMESMRKTPDLPAVGYFLAEGRRVGWVLESKGEEEQWVDG